MASWKDEIENQDERKVFEALADRKWDFRTVDGIRKASGLSKDEILSILNKYEGRLVRKSDLPSPQGKDIYTLKNEKSENQELLAKLRTFISKTVQ